MWSDDFIIFLIILEAIERSGGCGLKESDAKIVMEQITSALEFLHDKELVHRDVRAENVLIFSPDLTKVKLTDFGLTRKAGTLVKKRTRSLPTCPPETWELVHLEGDYSSSSLLFFSSSSPFFSLLFLSYPVLLASFIQFSCFSLFFF